MNLKEIFHLNSFIHKIKLDKSERQNSDYQGNLAEKEKNQESDEVFSNEWNQEYELIYASYVLEK